MFNVRQNVCMMFRIIFTAMKEIYKIDSKGSNVLHHLAYEGKIEISHMLTKLLLENNNSIIDIQDNNGQTALMIASSYNHNNPKMVKILLENNANISLRNKQGLMLASEYSRNSHMIVIQMIIMMLKTALVIM